MFSVFLKLLLCKLRIVYLFLFSLSIHLINSKFRRLELNLSLRFCKLLFRTLISISADLIDKRNFKIDKKTYQSSRKHLMGLTVSDNSIVTEPCQTFYKYQ